MDFLGLVVTPVVTQSEKVEIVSLSILYHLLVKRLIAHEHVTPNVGGSSLLALWQVKDFVCRWFQQILPDDCRIDSHCDFDDDLIFVKTLSLIHI